MKRSYSTTCPIVGFAFVTVGARKLVTLVAGRLMQVPAVLLALAALGAAAPAHSANEKVVYSFKANAAYPKAGLVNVDGALYGTAAGGRAPRSGTVFKLKLGGSEKTIHFFTTNSDGATLYAGLINVRGTLYGTTVYGGGSCNCGTVFSITTGGAEKVLYSFHGGSDGALPGAGLVNVAGTLYGTTHSGGTKGYGTVFSLSSAGAEKVLYSFLGGNDGATPAAGLVNVDGTLYGTTAGGGGSTNSGTVFSVTTAGAEKVIYSFQGRNVGPSSPEGSLVNLHGTLYGTTFSGGTYDRGTVFSVTTTGTETVLHSFQAGSDGSAPAAGLINTGGALLGTTTAGGTGNCTGGFGNGCGTVFSVTTGGFETVLYSFQGQADGDYPAANLVNVGGALYGTTTYGGASLNCTNGCGTVFAVTP